MHPEKTIRAWIYDHHLAYIYPGVPESRFGLIYDPVFLVRETTLAVAKDELDRISKIH
jgi:hypothetical protein